ncbi:MAG: tetratricopeptide repeat protein [Thermodesulfobacteriota bacterium]
MKKRMILICLIPLVAAAMVSGCGHTKANNKNNGKASAARDLGEAYMAEGNYTRALRELLKAEKMDPDDPYVQNDLGLTYLAKNDAEKAVTHFRRALEIKPDYSPARNNLGSAYISLQQWDKAIECFKTVKDDLLYATPQYPASNLGLIYYRKGEYEKAKQHYQEALDLKSGFPKALHGLGQVYMATGEHAKAVRKLEEAAEKVGRSARLYLDLGRAYEKHQQYNKALNAYKKAESIAVGTPLADKAKAAIKTLRSKW